MKIFLSFVIIFNLKNIYAAEDACVKEKNQKKQSLACSEYLKNQIKDQPCLTDISNYCIPKDIGNIDSTKNIKIEDINLCLEKNFKKLSPNCQKFLEIKKSSRLCMEAALAKCKKLSPSLEIDCLAEEQPKAIDECKKMH